jgi:hypothetical protein
MDAMLKACVETLRAKGEEYSGTEDRLRNFRETAAACGVDIPVVWMVFFRKGLAAVEKWCRDGELKSNESIHDRIKDAINYLLLLELIALEEERGLPR